MPQIQVANVQIYDGGAPVAEATVFQFTVLQGGILDLVFSAEESEVAPTVTVQVSDDGTSWSDTTAAANIQAVADEAVQVKTRKSFSVLMRQGVDKHMRVLAKGGCRFNMQVRGGEDVLQIKMI